MLSKELFNLVLEKERELEKYMTCLVDTKKHIDSTTDETELESLLKEYKTYGNKMVSIEEEIDKLKSNPLYDKEFDRDRTFLTNI